MSYNVVYQYGKKLGGFYGARYLKSYINKSQFEADIPLNLEVIKSGLSHLEAESLVAQTPEICLITFAVESYFDNFKKPSALGLAQLIQEYKNFTIPRHRKTLLLTGTKRINARPFIEHFRQMVQADQYSRKSFAIMGALSAIVNEDTGEVS